MALLTELFALAPALPCERSV